MSKEADSPVVVRGVQRTIEYAVCSNGSMPAKDFVEGKLDQSDQAKLLSLFKRMADHGSVPNREQFKRVEDDIFEFKKHQFRVFCFRKDNRWLLTNGYRKKKDKLDPSEIERAKRVKMEHLRREAGRQERRTR
jgi:hypothetical protein